VENDLTIDQMELQARMINQEGVRVDYEDTAGKRYWSVIKSIDGYLVIETGETETTSNQHD
jgi:hypothetical protein